MNMTPMMPCNTAYDDAPCRQRPISQRLLLTVLGILLLSFSAGAMSAENALEAIRYTTLPGDQIQIELKMSEPTLPVSFTTENPARIAFDFPDTASRLEKKTQPVDVGVVKSITTVESKGRTRLVINLSRLTAYQTRAEGNRIFITLNTDQASVPASAPEASVPAAAATPAAPPAYGISNIDFRRGEKGEARIILKLSHPGVPADIREEGKTIIADFSNTQLPKELQRRLDVTDFATPVSRIDALSQGSNTRLKIIVTGDYEHLAYQTGNTFTIEIKPVSMAQKERGKSDEGGYSGEKLSLSFQNIEIRAALQIIADFTGLNMVTSDTVSGNVSLRLKNVPWDQALDIILKSKGLGMRKMGNVVLIAPGEEIAAREKQELEAKKQVNELEPLKSEIIQINYAKAADFAALLKAKENSLLSARGNVTVDVRTNTLLIQDTISRLDEIRKVIAKLDAPVRQVLIESRIVIANNDFSKELGARFGVTRAARNGNTTGIVSTTGSAAGNNTMVNAAISNATSTGIPTPVLPTGIPALANRFNVSLPATTLANAGRIGLAILGNDYLLDLELSALQAEGRGDVVSSPRVITANQKEAFIEQGVEIPYQEASSSGATSVSFKKAVLSLKVTPQITPDDRIIMDLKVNKDNVGQIYQGVPSINTREISTQVLVENGETVVLGGIYEQTRLKNVDKVPFFGDLPVVGALFRNTINQDDKAELLIFVTPRVLKESLGLR